MTAPSHDTLVLACESLTERDPALARAYAVIGLPVWREGEASYEAIARMVAYQQITTIAAASIWARVIEKYGKVTPETVLAASEDDLRACGLSRPKIRHMTSIAEATVSGALNYQRCLSAPLDEARKELTAVKGIGPWTAELFLLYAGNVDAFPPGDVGLMEAHKLLSKHETRMDAKAFTAHAESWRPYRGVAAHLLWGWLHVERAKVAEASSQA